MSAPSGRPYARRLLLAALVTCLAIIIPGITGITGITGPVHAQTPFMPYHGKNLIHYDTFKWQVYETEHFTFYYYPEIKDHLERVVGYAESAYEKISADLAHELPSKVSWILFKTHSEFEQQNVASPEASSEGVAAFAESERNRIVMPIDEPSDRLFGLIVHELTHQFNNDIVPPGLIRRSTPLWINEGLADYMRGQWDPIDLMTVRDAAVADIIPRMSRLEGYGEFGSPRLIYNLGHAVFEFIEGRFGKEGVRGFLFALRKSVIGAGDDAYEEAFQMRADQFDQAFDRYLKERFKPFRDKERPEDYGPSLSPNRDRPQYGQALSIAPSPAGELLATFAANQKDNEVDIILMSARDGSVVKNLTPGFNMDLGFSHIIVPGERFNQVPWMSWSPTGDRLAYFARTEKERALVIQNIVDKDRRIEQKIPLKSVDEPESPAFSRDGTLVAFSALRNGIGDIFTINLRTQEIVNLTNDAFADFAPMFSPDGKFLVYVVRVSGNQKLFKLDLATRAKTQLSFSPTDETGAQFIDDHTLLFASTATDPRKPLEPEVAANGNVFNIWTLDLNSNELKQYTDTLGGNFSPVVLQAKDGVQIAFVTYYKGDWGVRSIELRQPLHTAASADFGSPGPIVDFQSPMSHTLVQANTRPKKMFERMFLSGLPAVSVMVTNNGDVFGGTAIGFGDVLGDHQFLVYADTSVQYASQSRTFLFNWSNRSRRLQYALEARMQTQFYFAAGTSTYLSPIVSPFLSTSEDTRGSLTERGGSIFAIYPIDRYRRAEMFGGFFHFSQHYSQTAQEIAQGAGVPISSTFRSGFATPMGVSFVQETTVFRDFGPLAGNTIRANLMIEPPIASLSSQTIDVDARFYQRLATSGVLALRVRGFKSAGSNPRQFWFGGNGEMRGYDYLQFVGNNAMFANAELRFPIIDAALTPIGVVGALRGVFFANIGGAFFSGNSFDFFETGSEQYRPIVGAGIDPGTGLVQPIYGLPRTIDGLRLKDGRASYGVGLQTFLLGFPLHIDWSWRTLFSREWEDALFAAYGGSHEFRKVRFGVWVGYDF